jgi:TIR domain
VPRWAAGVGVLAGVYVVVMVAAALWMPLDLDRWAFRWLGSHAVPAFSPEVSIVDIAWDPHDVAGNRLRVANFLDGLVKSNQRPDAVILDIEFDPCQTTPCGEPMSSARATLVKSIRAATRYFPVFATEEPGSFDREDNPLGPLDRQDAQIYGAISGAAQTRFPTMPDNDGLFYRICYAGVPFVDEAGDVQGTQSVWSMVVRVLMTPRLAASSPACDTQHVPVRLGPSIAGSPASPVYPFTDARSFSKYAQFDNRMFVIVGTMRYDRSPFVDRSGPEVLGWALSNALDLGTLVGKGAFYDVQAQNGMLLILVPGFSALAVLAYVALFFQLKRMRLGAFRPFAPWVSSALAAAIGLAIFAAFEAWMLLSHHIQPQVSLVVLGVVLASGLGGVHGSQVLLDEANTIDPTPQERYDYDVFVSYAHEDGAWVFEHVYVPFRDAVLPNGKKLSIFFDTSSIRTGTGWQTTLSMAIDGSRFIVPVYSETYFKKPYCRFEILRAHRKWVLAGEESRCVLPIMRGHPRILGTVDDIQALSVDDHPDLVAQQVAEVVERLSRESTLKASPGKGAAP